VAYKPIKRCE